jgi:hypothetical protein
MTIFDLLFIALFLASVVTLLGAAALVFGGRGAWALRIFRAWAIGAAIYLGFVALTSVFWPRRVLTVGEPLCFDDWCIAVDSFTRTPGQGTITYVVPLQLSSRARRVAQRENGVVVYLSDARGRRYNPVPAGTAVPFDVRLQPEESVATARSLRSARRRAGGRPRDCARGRLPHRLVHHRI